MRETEIKLLRMILDRECDCDKSRCAEHFMYLEKLLYEYEAERDSNNNTEP